MRTGVGPSGTFFHYTLKQKERRATRHEPDPGKGEKTRIGLDEGSAGETLESRPH
jgi:hypothetical protein